MNKSQQQILDYVQVSKFYEVSKATNLHAENKLNGFKLLIWIFQLQRLTILGNLRFDHVILMTSSIYHKNQNFFII